MSLSAGKDTHKILHGIGWGMEKGGPQGQTEQKSAAFFAKGRAGLRALTQPDPSEASGQPQKNIKKVLSNRS